MRNDRSNEVDAYLAQLFVGEDPVLERDLAASEAAGLPPIAVSPVQGKLLYLLARLRGARRILEVGTLGGYSALWLARALPHGGRLVTLEIDPVRAALARANLEEAGLEALTTVGEGPALESLERLISEQVEPFDFVFIDADKRNNPRYLELALVLAHPGTLIVVDNVVRGGDVLDGEESDPDVAGTRRCLEMLATDPRFEATALQTVGAKGWDGFAVAIVR